MADEWCDQMPRTPFSERDGVALQVSSALLTLFLSRGLCLSIAGVWSAIQAQLFTQLAFILTGALDKYNPERTFSALGHTGKHLTFTNGLRHAANVRALINGL